MSPVAPALPASDEASVAQKLPSSMDGNAGSNGHTTYGVLSLASHESKFVTGPELISDGGATAAG